MFSSLARSPSCTCKQDKNNITILVRSQFKARFSVRDHSNLYPRWYCLSCHAKATMQFSCHLLRLLFCEFAPGWHRHDHICRAATCCDFFDGARLDTQQYMNVFCAPSCLSLLTTTLLTLQVRTSLYFYKLASMSIASLVLKHYTHSSHYACSTSSPALPARSPSSLISTIDRYFTPLTRPVPHTHTYTSDGSAR